MRRFLSIFTILVFCLFISTSPIYSKQLIVQSNPIDNPNTSLTINTGNQEALQIEGSPVQDIIDWLVGLFKPRETEKIKDVATSYLPAKVEITPIQMVVPNSNLASNTTLTIESEPQKPDEKKQQREWFSDVVGGYTVASEVLNPSGASKENVSPDIPNFFERIFGHKPSDKEIVEQTSKQAGKYAASYLPGSLANNFQEQANMNTSLQALGEGDGEILGVEADTRILRALAAVQCGNLPYNENIAETFDCPNIALNTIGEDLIVPTFPPEIPISSAPVQVESCSEGSGYCSVDYLNSHGFSKIDSAKVASIVCQRESGSNPLVPSNDGCLTGRSHEYSIGLFQINIIAHLGRLIETGIISSDCQDIIIDQWDTNRRCVIPDMTKLERCITPLKEPDNNIKYAVILSKNGTNWNPWSAARVCGVLNGLPATPTLPVDFIRVPGTDLYLQDFNQGNMRPTQIVIHWSGAWTSARATADYLRNRVDGYGKSDPLSCHLATDANTQLQLLKFFGNQAQWAWCVGPDDNGISLNNELSGVDFDEILENSSHWPQQYASLMSETEKAVETTCWMMQQYNINISNIRGHFEFTKGKSDPGKNYLNFFKSLVAKKCP